MQPDQAKFLLDFLLPQLKAEQATTRKILSIFRRTKKTTGHIRSAKVHSNLPGKLRGPSSGSWTLSLTTSSEKTIPRCLRY